MYWCLLLQHLGMAERKHFRILQNEQKQPSSYEFSRNTYYKCMNDDVDLCIVQSNGVWKAHLIIIPTFSFMLK